MCIRDRMDVMESARIAEEKGKDIIHMEVGQPGTPAPKFAKDYITNEINKNNLGYTVSLGLPALRTKISKLYGDWYNLDLNPNRIVVTTGSSGAFILSFSALFDSGDRVGIGSPSYPSYRQILKSLSLETVDIQTKLQNRFQPVPEDITDNNLNGILVASPANPTGSMLDKQSLENLINTANENNVSFISDEIYHGIQYENNPTSALEISNECYVINSFSKYFSMTGWRVGWMIVPEDHVRQVERLSQNLFISSGNIAQYSALKIFECIDELNETVKKYSITRKQISKLLSQIKGLNYREPDGAFYFYLDITDLNHNSEKLTKKIFVLNMEIRL